MTSQGDRRRQLASLACSCFSIPFTALVLVALSLVAGAVTDSKGFGLYQRINCVFGVCWLAAVVWLDSRQYGSHP